MSESDKNTERANTCDDGKKLARDYEKRPNLLTDRFK